MQIPREQVVRLLRSRGEHQQAELPDPVDTDSDVDALARLGVDRKDLMSRLGAGVDPGQAPDDTGT